jgi:hypothetical protein
MMRRPVVVLVVALAALGSVPVAKASCAQAPPLRQSVAEADIVFVGTVVGLDHDGRTATFRVEAVWKGALGETVVVHGGPGIAAIEEASRKGQGVATSVDRTFSAGTRYLVLPFGSSGDVLQDNICSNTQPYTDDLARLRPTGAHPPLAGDAPVGPSATGDDGRSTWILLGGLAALATALATALAWSRLRARRA